jgi:inner membrane protein
MTITGFNAIMLLFALGGDAMDPVTHAIIGMSIVKAAGHDILLTDPITTGIIIGSMFPDLDILMQKWGDYVYLKNHRGASHSIIGLVISSVFITGAMKLIYPGAEILSLFLWVMAGCLSHSLIDVFNTYGAKLFWPFFKKRLTLELLVVFDPIFTGLLLAYSFSGRSAGSNFLYALGMYILLRFLMRTYIKTLLMRKFKSRRTALKLLPSVTGIFRWHFILEKRR